MMPNQIVFRYPEEPGTNPVFVSITVVDGMIKNENIRMIECETLNEMGFDQVSVGIAEENGALELNRFYLKNDATGGPAVIHEMDGDELAAIIGQLFAETEALQKYAATQ